MLYQLVSVVCCSYVIWRLWFKKSHLEPPLLSGWLPIVGHGYKIMGDGEKMLEALKKTGQECTEKGGIVTIYFGWRKLYCVTDPYDSVTIMNTCLDKHYFYRFVKPLIGNGLVTADVPTWKKNRKLLNPVFHQHVLDGFIQIFDSQAEKLLDRFVKEVGKPFNHEKILRIENLETICCTSFGVCSTDSEQSKIFVTQYLHYLTSVIQAINVRVQKFWLHSDFFFNMTKEKKQVDEGVKHLSVLSNLLIQKIKAEKKNEKENVLLKDTKPGKFKPFLDLILDLADKTDCFTDEQIKDETDTIMIAGHETSSTVLTFALSILGSHPDVQEKAYQEVCTVLQNNNKIEKEDLANLVYIEAILKEILRLYTVFPVIPRYVDKDVKLKNYTMKANSDCIILVHGLHRHSIWGTDADQFRPERWLDKTTLPDPKYFGGFGLGRRACIGKTYAMMSIKIIVAKTLRKFQITSEASKIVEQMSLALRPKSGYYITLRERREE